MALHIVTEGLEVVIQASAILFALATHDINYKRPLLTFTSSKIASSCEPRIGDVACWLIYFRAVLRLGLCPELRVTKTVRLSRLALSAIDSNNDTVILLSGPVTTNPVRSLPFDLKHC